MMKKLFLSAIISAASVFAMAQTQSVTHVVQRGETIESIAEYYHVSVDDINKANPNADGLVYVGMKLVVPVRQGQKVEEVVNVTPNAVNKVEEIPYNAQTFGEVRHENPVQTEEERSPWAAAFEIGYGFLKGSSNFQYEFTFGANYRFPFNLYAGARIGYNSSNYNMSESDGNGHSINIESTCHFIEIPLEVGYALTTSNKLWGIVPFAGINTNIGLTGKNKYKELGSGGEKHENKIKIGGKFGFEARFGVRLRLAEFNISGSYRIPLNDKQKGWVGEDAYPEITIGWGF